MCTYNLPQIDEKVFEAFNTMVQACFDQGKQRSEHRLLTISTEVAHLHKTHAAYVNKHQPLAVAIAAGKHLEDFNVWVNPQYKEDSFKFRLTLAHELVHGYAGIQYGHSAHWRRWYYRVVTHLYMAEFIPEPVDKLPVVLWGTGMRYNHTGDKRQEIDLVTEAMAKAKSEHDDVIENFWSRIA